MNKLTIGTTMKTSIVTVIRGLMAGTQYDIGDDLIMNDRLADGRRSIKIGYWASMPNSLLPGAGLDKQRHDYVAAELTKLNHQVEVVHTPRGKYRIKVGTPVLKTASRTAQRSKKASISK